MKSKRLSFLRKPLLAATIVVLGGAGSVSALATDGQFTIIQTGDFHGHLTPRPNLRSNAPAGQMVGGLARIATKIKEIEGNSSTDAGNTLGGAGGTLVLHTGDTIQGSGEAMYTRGQAMVDVVDMLGIDHYAPGNWDFVYGADRFKELFAASLNANMPTLPAQAAGKVVAPPFGTRWGGLVANVYVTSANPNTPKDPGESGTEYDTNLSQAEYDDYANWYMENGQRVLPPYAVHHINGVKVGVIGCTTSRGPQVVGKWVTQGLSFTDCSKEIKKFAKLLRTVEQVDVVVLISEIEIGRNIVTMKGLAADEHVDIVLNSDMHEETLVPISVVNPSTGKTTKILEAGQDGTLLNELKVTVANGVVTVAHTAHRIDQSIAEDAAVAVKVAQVRAPFNENFDASIPCGMSSPYVNPFTVMALSGVTDTDVTCLTGPLSEVVGRTEVALHRSNYSHENMAAAIEGTSHDFIADAIRWWAKSDIAAVRGFRYGTHVAPGDITRNDLYHFVPIGPRVGKGSRVSVNQLRNQIDNSSLAVFSTDPNNPVTPRPNYNNAAYAPGGIFQALSPGAGLPVKGGSGNALGLGGGWLFSYSAEGFHFDFDPYFQPTSHTKRSGSPFDASNKVGGVPTGNTISGLYLDIDPATGKSYNGQYANPPSDTSRVRNWAVQMPCNKLPLADRTRHDVGWNGEAAPYATGVVVITLNNDVTCTVGNPGYTGSGKTVITKAKDGVYMPSWTANYAAGAVYTPYLVNPAGWQYLNGTPNQPATNNTINQHFKAALFNIAGYWYKQSPNTVNNCNNCYTGGSVQGVVRNAGGVITQNNMLSGGILNDNVAYLLPVNEDVDASGNPTGAPALDANGNPKVVTDNGTLVWESDKDGAKPKVAGKPIELTEVIVKYLAYLGAKDGGVNDNNLPQNRISLVKTTASGNTPTALPNFANSTLGFPVMQPLCGTIGKDPISTAACP